ncbi:activator of osmoprotectant transporter ProP [Legionella oakridgensis ATCC 33761 = DSM 21215]|uniref:Activator of osmoprotectant transporter ProP n=1 Tax=Legionella oakridgensis ATCC 33761 = DSM 21215 TaxID=1268635 RepID=W0B5I3_9GAMM|nr:activator of osmoprotectant transporter ProP [Legionella oakridgensis ATCC 33761 = DSM 21215]
MRVEALRWLAATFPSAFDNTRQIRPLKVGIMNDILVHAEEAATAGISRGKLREAVVIFTRRIDYLASIKARETRVDLHGSPVGQVTEEEAERAATKIKKMVEKSAKNARKNLIGKSVPNHFKMTSSLSYHSESELMSYSEQFPALSAQSAFSPPAKSAPVMVKHKSARPYDPEAVARLKEKLGLSRKKEPVE